MGKTIAMSTCEAEIHAAVVAVKDAIHCVTPGDTCVKLCPVGDTGLKTGWVRCRHGAGRGVEGLGRGGVGWSGEVTYFADRIVPQYKS